MAETMPRPSRHASALARTLRARWPWVVTTAAAASLLWLAGRGAPALDQDASYFLGSAMSLARGDGLTNRLDALLVTQDPAGQARLVAYPPAFPMVLGMLGASDVSQAYLTMAWLAIVPLVGLTILLERAASAAGPVGRAGQAGAVLGLSSLFANGAIRPEALSIALVLLWIGAVRTIRASTRRDLLLGALAGVTACVQVPNALYGILAWLAVESRQATLPALADRSLRFAVGFLCFAALGLWSHPFGARVYVQSFLGFSGSVLHQGDFQLWVKYWLAGVRFPGLALPFVLVLVVLVLRYRNAWRMWASPATLFGALAIATALLVRDTMVIPTRWYEAAVFLPLAYWVLLCGALDRQGSPSTWRSVVAAATLLAMGINATGILRRVAQGVAMTLEGTTLADARKALGTEVALRGGLGVVGVEAPLGFLLDRSERACLVAQSGVGDDAVTCNVMPKLLVSFEGRHGAGAALPAVRPLNAGARAARARERWQLACTFDGSASARLRLPYTRSRGWSFAVYERLPLDPEGAFHVSGGSKGPSRRDETIATCGGRP